MQQPLDVHCLTQLLFLFFCRPAAAGCRGAVLQNVRKEKIILISTIITTSVTMTTTTTIVMNNDNNNNSNNNNKIIDFQLQQRG